MMKGQCLTGFHSFVPIIMLKLETSVPCGPNWNSPKSHSCLSSVGPCLIMQIWCPSNLTTGYHLNNFEALKRAPEDHFLGFGFEQLEAFKCTSCFLLFHPLIYYGHQLYIYIYKMLFCILCISQRWWPTNLALLLH